MQSLYSAQEPSLLALLLGPAPELPIVNATQSTANVPSLSFQYQHNQSLMSAVASLYGASFGLCATSWPVFHPTPTATLLQQAAPYVALLKSTPGTPLDLYEKALAIRDLAEQICLWEIRLHQRMQVRCR
jgi:hypothetical protein